MEQYISKSDLVAEIKEYIDNYNKGYSNGDHYKADALKTLLQDINFFFEVKEVDLDKEFDNYAKDILACDVQFEPFTHLYKCAKYFYELGLKTQKGE